MNEILNYYFFKDVIDNLEKKYHNIIKDETKNAFLFSNIIEMPLYYNFFKNKNNKDYNLYKHFHNDKFFEVINIMANKVLENDYNPKLLLLLYGYISSYIFSKYLNQYLDIYKLFKERHLKSLEKMTYETKENKKYSRLNIAKEFLFEQDPLIIDVMQEVVAKLYYNSYGEKILEKGINNYQKYMYRYNVDPLRIKRLYLGFLGLFSKRNKIDKRILVHSYKSLLDSTNKSQKEWYLFNELVNYNYQEMYQLALNEASVIINIISEQIFYKKKTNISKLDKFSHLG